MPAASAQRTADLDDLHGTLRRLLGEHETLFEGTWQRLTLAQRGALRARGARGGPRAALGRRPRPVPAERHLHRAGVARRAGQREDVLAREGDRYVVVDSLFREWVARRTF